MFENHECYVNDCASITLEIDGKETLDNFVSLCLDCGKVVLIRKSSNEKTD